MTARPGSSVSWSLAALGIGLGLGLVFHRAEAAWIEPVAGTLAGAGRLWIRALQVTVVPLVITQVVVALLTTSRLGVLGLRTLLVFSAMLLATLAVTLLLAPLSFTFYHIDRSTIAALLAGVSAPESAAPATATGHPLLRWLWRFVLGEFLLYVLLGSALFALAVRRITGPARAAIQRGFEGSARVIGNIVGALLLLAPLGILALSFGLARSAGGSALGLLTFFVLLECGLALTLTVLLYPATAVLGGVPVRRFARAAAPAQVVGLSTRSSLAALPAMVAATKELRLPPAAAGFVLPFAVATVKLSRAMSAPLKLLFLAFVLGLPLGAERLILFVFGALLLSFAVPGLPGHGPEAATLPLYLAAGIPLGGIVILEAVDAIPDMFKTALNVTGILSGGAIVTRAQADGSA